MDLIQKFTDLDGLDFVDTHQQINFDFELNKNPARPMSS